MNSKVQTTVYEMLTDRGYSNIQKISDVIILSSNISNNEKILVFNILENKAGIKSVKILANLIQDHECTRLIIIYRDNKIWH